jgi:hypothetical protein
MQLFKLDKNRDITQGKPIALLLKCPVCNKLRNKTNPMYIWDIKRNWNELVSQKDLINAQDINLCCKKDLEYYIGKKIAREVIFS